jgi:hypothetical protein
VERQEVADGPDDADHRRGNGWAAAGTLVYAVAPYQDLISWPEAQ